MIINLGFIILFLILLTHKLRKPLLTSLFFSVCKTAWLVVNILLFNPSQESAIILTVGILISFALSWLLGWVIAWLQTNYREKVWAHLVTVPIVIILLIV